MMTPKGGNFVEQHIEKAILGIAVLVSGFLLYKFVLVSPYSFKYGGKNLSSGQLDTCINDEAQELRKRLNEEAISKKVYDPKLNLFLAKMNIAVTIDANIVWPLPSSIEMRVDKKYRIPAVGAVKDVAAVPVMAMA